MIEYDGPLDDDLTDEELHRDNTWAHKELYGDDHEEGGDDGDNTDEV